MPDASSTPVAAARLRPHRLTVAGVETGLLRLGVADRPALLLVHGFSGDMMTWQFNMGQLARRFQVTAIDLPGHGSARGESGIGPWREMADWLGAFLAVADLRRVHLVGHSLGARLALALAERGDARVESLTLIACAGITPSHDYEFLQRLSRIETIEDALHCSRRLVGGAEIDLQRFARSLHAKLSDEAAQANLARFLAHNFAGGKLLPSAPVDWAKVRVPLQFIWGQDDTVIAAPPAAWLPEETPCHVLDKVGHVPHMVAPDRVNRLILDFLSPSP